MPSQFKQAIESPLVARERINKRVVRQVSVSKELSPVLDEESEKARITNDYIKESYLNRIINKKTGREAMNSLLTDPSYGDIDSFDNLLTGLGLSGKEDYVNWLVGKYRDNNLRKIKDSKLTLPSKKVIPGSMGWNDKIYLRIGKDNILRAYRFKDNRFAKMPKGIKRERFI